MPSPPGTAPPAPPPLAAAADAGTGADVEPAAYANHFAVGFNAFEFLLDFGQAYAGDESALQHTRVVTAPAYARVFHALLTRSLREYEALYGPIPEAGELGAEAGELGDE